MSRLSLLLKITFLTVTSSKYVRIHNKTNIVYNLVTINQPQGVNS